MSQLPAEAQAAKDQHDFARASLFIQARALDASEAAFAGDPDPEATARAAATAADALNNIEYKNKGQARAALAHEINKARKNARSGAERSSLDSVMEMLP